MADQKRWFKVWTSIVGNARFAEMSLEDIGRWTLLGASTALDGDGGVLGVPGRGRELCRLLRVDTIEEAKVVLDRVFSVRFEEGKNVNGELSVTWKNWKKYQEDSTVAERVKRLRSKRRGEEKREEEIQTRARLNGHDQGFDAFWTAYPRHEAKIRALKAWTALHPTPELTATLLAAIEQHKQRLWAQAPPDKVPHPASWLNGRRWEDELPTAQGKDPYANFPKR